MKSKRKDWYNCNEGLLAHDKSQRNADGQQCNQRWEPVTSGIGREF